MQVYSHTHTNHLQTNMSNDDITAVTEELEKRINNFLNAHANHWQGPQASGHFEHLKDFEERLIKHKDLLQQNISTDFAPQLEMIDHLLEKISMQAKSIKEFCKKHEQCYWEFTTITFLVSTFKNTDDPVKDRERLKGFQKRVAALKKEFEWKKIYEDEKEKLNTLSPIIDQKLELTKKQIKNKIQQQNPISEGICYMDVYKVDYEILFRIFANLCRKELGTLRLVSKNINTLVTDDRMWKVYCAQIFPDLTKPHHLIWEQFHKQEMVDLADLERHQKHGKPIRVIYKKINDVMQIPQEVQIPIEHFMSLNIDMKNLRAVELKKVIRQIYQLNVPLDHMLLWKCRQNDCRFFSDVTSEELTFTRTSLTDQLNQVDLVRLNLNVKLYDKNSPQSNMFVLFSPCHPNQKSA
jgi:hypothetical protein